jgi:transcriptional regulator with XRE-family HTH domain
MTIQLPQRRGRPRDTFALRLLALRHELGMTQQQIADLVGVKRGAWNTWEEGRIPREQAKVARLIADRTGYERDWLLYGGELGATPTDDDHPTGRFPVRVGAQELRARRLRPTPERPFWAIQTAA